MATENDQMLQVGIQNDTLTLKNIIPYSSYYPYLCPRGKVLYVYQEIYSGSHYNNVDYSMTKEISLTQQAKKLKCNVMLFLQKEILHMLHTESHIHTYAQIYIHINRKRSVEIFLYIVRICMFITKFCCIYFY